MLNHINKLKDNALHLNSLRKFVTNKTFFNAIRVGFKLKILTKPLSGNVLVLSPHPDDDVFGCGGTIKIHTESNDSVTVLYFTNGGNKSRRFEAEQACQLLGVKKTIFWNYDDNQIKDSKKTVEDLVEIISKTNPKTIYVPSFTDPHPDHFLVSLIFRRSLEKVIFTGQIFSYEVWQPVYANRLICIDSVVNSKKEAIKAHESQLNNRSYYFAILGLNKYRAGMHSIGEYAEGFFACNKELYLELTKNI